ncbi:ATP-binding cassette domain-containing protein [Lysinibacter sp. HNR]|uniref:ATP-binding cassette domain-containing protein n=1 Tax=Lysinibacter sp. HNR TaxID=3031408 RepID=UPI002435F86C|nr:ATP-binding cassette domain-containing protein [Lysinibacter sp. HNR]WGD38269.1 ATP-binding cassette domain-containing protein [Lysinibacter sp. HNR]
MPSALLELRNITKAFGDKVANNNISFAMLPGQVHAIVGENGAGKTTLMSMIAGTEIPDSGEILVNGIRVTIAGPRDAARLGIGMVHQHFKLVPSLSVAANVFLGREPRTSWGTLDTKLMAEKVNRLAGEFGLEINPQALVRDLSIGLRQRVEIIKALSYDTKILILDEPTAVLTPSEAEDLFAVIRKLAAAGCAIVFISHKLDEVLAVAQVLTVIRDGQNMGTHESTGMTQSDIARLMVGREVLLRSSFAPGKATQETLTVKDLTHVNERGVTVLNRLNLTLRSGEILGIAGVEGNGQAELTSIIAGLTRTDSGTLTLHGHDITHESVAQRRKQGLAYIPEDRLGVGTGPSLSVADNVLATHATPPRVRAGWISTARSKKFAAKLISLFDIRGAHPATPIKNLSGGNMQKVIIARELITRPSLLIASQPTRGVDVGAMEFVHSSLIAARDEGSAVLLVSADLNEVMSLSDRIVVMFRGRIIAEFTRHTMTEEAIGLAMTGQVPPALPNAAAQEKQSQEHHLQDSTSPLLTEQKQEDTPEYPLFTEHQTGASPQDTSKEPVRQRMLRFLRSLAKGSVQPVIAVAVSLLIGAAIIITIGENPIRAYDELFFSSFRSSFGIAALIAQFIPLVIMATAVTLSFRAGFFNLGGEGQLYLGALSAALVGHILSDLPGPLLTAVVIGAGFLGGALWGSIPGTLFALWRVDIIVTTLMMSSIGVLLTAYLVTGPLKDPELTMAASPPIAPQAMLPLFNEDFGIGADLLLALIVVCLTALLLTRSVWGLRVRQVGELNNFAPYTGVSTRILSVQVMALSGGLAGIAGSLFVLGPNGGQFLQIFSPGYGFLGITVALLARLNPWAGIFAAAFYATMMSGSNGMQINTEVPYPLVNILQGLIILLITATVIINKHTRERLVRLFRLHKRHGLTSTSLEANS